ncbi:Zinc finger MIZ-type [Penicillium bovifimosum]|uniref:Zinc finger MIZ-type n=1 Tax=Penicillium bovifimosum TaxID=126998 RepID=A0A9W9GX98_9EURO|nr:Zinc finger MIZ-type [Penicillium bovifimosum]KAJ5130974.1 Zinc finger MIZ-type [Penicillium bovifimosum]
MEESNTTAHLFLGGVRRDWMGRHTDGPHAGTIPRVNRQARAPTSSLPQSTLMSTVTSGENPRTQHDSGPAIHPAKSATPATGLPSPVPTDPEPIPLSTDAIVANIPSTLPPNPAQSTAQRGDDKRMAIQSPSNGSTMEQPMAQSTLPVANRSQTNSPLDRGLMEQRVSGQTEQQLQGDAPAPISDEIWELWAAQMDLLTNNLQAEGALSPVNPTANNIVQPRIDLLRQALNHKDSFYLVVHQLYCEYSTDPNRVDLSGTQNLVPLLEDNRKMHPAATISFANFPSAPYNLMQQPWYHLVLSKIDPFLARLATSWRDFWVGATHPPLVTELWSKLQLPSPILMTVMFMFVSRRLHDEAYIKPLMKLFWRDYELCKRFIDAGVPCGPELEPSNRWLITVYRKYPRLPTSQSQSPRLPDLANARTDQTQPSFSPSTSHLRPQIAQTTHRNAGATMPRRLGSATNTHTAPVRRSAGRPYAGYFSSNPPQGQVTGAVGLSPEYGPVNAARMQNSYPYYVHFPQGQGQPQGQGYWLQMHDPQVQMIALGQAPPSQMCQSPQMPQGQRLQPPNATTPTVPTHLVLQSNTVSSTHSPQSPALLSAIRTISTPTAQQSLPPRPPHDQHIRQHSPTSNAHFPSNLHTPPSETPTLQKVSNSLLLPPPGHRAPMTVNANPLRIGLHVADLRDPIKRVVREDSKGSEIETGLWAYADSFLVQPTVIDPGQAKYTWTFSLTPDERQRFPMIVQGTRGRRSVWTFKPGCRHYRLRSLRVPDNPDTVTERSWYLASTVWPSVLYVFVNNKELYVRRKVHNEKDLPLDLTEHLQSGENTLEVHFLLGPDECNNTKYVFGVEVLQIDEFDNILSQVQSIPAADSRAAIQKRLSPITDDDDLAVVTDNITIGLVDPFMARIFDVPVRSRKCEHHECFDRDTFIRTRISVSGQAPLYDNWRCPICKADARPRFLVVDEFLAEVHAELARTNRLDTATAIRFKADGTWTLRVDTDEASGSNPLKRKADDSGDPAAPNALRPKSETISASPAVRSQEPEIIELD